MVISKLKSMLQIFTGGMEAAFGNMWFKKEYDTLNKVFHSFEFIVYSFTTIAFSCALVLILPFVRLYTKGVTDINYLRPDFAFLVIAAESIFCIREPYLLIVQAAGCYEETKKGAIMEAVINLSSSLILVNICGINGVIIGTLLANLFRSIQYAWFASKHLLKRNCSVILKRLLLMIVNMVLIICISFYIQNHVHFETSWIGWVLNAIVVFGVSVVMIIFTGMIFYKSDVEYLLTKVRNMGRKGS